jgi:histone arginine demethylase JMJD6
MEIQKVDQITYREFIDNFYKPGIPVVFKNATRVWKANGLFSPDWFRQNFAGKTIEKNGRTYSMREVLDLVETSTEANPAPYPFIFDIPSNLHELMPYIQPLDLGYARPNWLQSKWFRRGYWGSALEVFIGGPGGKFPYLHIDFFHLNAWINQLYGRKQFTVYPKGQDDCLYPRPDDPWRSQVNIFEPDYAQFPKYKDATPIHFTVEAGETLFIPAGTWHSAYSPEPTISVAFDQLNGKNFRDFMKDVWTFKLREGRLKAISQYGYAWVGGQFCKMDRQMKLEQA